METGGMQFRDVLGTNIHNQGRGRSRPGAKVRGHTDPVRALQKAWERGQPWEPSGVGLGAGPLQLLTDKLRGAGRLRKGHGTTTGGSVSGTVSSSGTEPLTPEGALQAAWHPSLRCSEQRAWRWGEFGVFQDQAGRRLVVMRGCGQSQPRARAWRGGETSDFNLSMLGRH